MAKIKDNKWILMDDDERLKAFSALLMSNISDETQIHADNIVKEICDTIVKINAVQQDFLAGKYPNSVNYLARQLDSIALDNHLDKDELYAAVLSRLYKSNHETLKLIINSDPPWDDVDQHVITPRTSQERNFVLNESGELLDTLPIGDLAVVVKSVFAKHNGESTSGDDIDADDQILSRQAFESDLLSKEETIFECLMAIHSYIDLHNNGKSKGLPLAEAIQNAVIGVTALKTLFKLKQNGNHFTNLLRKYLKSSRWATIVTLIRRITKDSEILLLYAGCKIIKRSAEAEAITQLLDVFHIGEDLKNILSFFLNTSKLPIIFKYIEPAIRNDLYNSANIMLPWLEIPVNYAINDLKDLLFETKKRSRMATMDLCRKTSSVFGKLASKIWESFDDADDQEYEKGKQSEDLEYGKRSEDEGQEENEDNKE